MSLYADRTTIMLHRMVKEMYCKNIELARVTKCAAQLLMTGVSTNSLPDSILEACIQSQHPDGGWVSVVYTIWNAKFLSFFNDTEDMVFTAIKYLNNNKVSEGFGRSKRDIPRIPVSGIAFYLLPQLASVQGLNWLEDLWISEKNGLTYKAAYTLLAFHENNYSPKCSFLINDILEWLVSQQDENGGFAPWKDHPVNTNVYCTAIALISILKYVDQFPQYLDSAEMAYNNIVNTQLPNGLWRYHELEDGGAWGLAALTQYERKFTIN